MHCTSCGVQLPDDARFCASCGKAVAAPVGAQPPTPPQPTTSSSPQVPPAPPARKGLSCFSVGCLTIIGIVLVTIIVAAININNYSSSNFTPARRAANNPAPQSYEARHTQRQAIHSYWVGATNQSVVALSYVQLALDAENEGDLVTASTALEKAGSAADQAEMDAVSTVPDGWDDVSGSLVGGDDALKSAVKSARSGLDSNAPSDWSDAAQSAEQASSSFDEATSEARNHYEAMGGHSDDIEDPRDEAKQVYNTLKSAISSSNQQ